MCPAGKRGLRCSEPGIRKSCISAHTQTINSIDLSWKHPEEACWTEMDNHTHAEVRACVCVTAEVMHTRTAQRSFQFPVPQTRKLCLFTKPARNKAAHSCLQSDNKIDISLLPRAEFHNATAKNAQNGEGMKENTYRKRENDVPRGANRSGFRNELREVRDDAQLMMISLFDVHVISLFFPSPKVKCKEKKGSASLSSPQDRDSPRLPLPRSLCPSPCPPQSIPDTWCQL